MEGGLGVRGWGHRGKGEGGVTHGTLECPSMHIHGLTLFLDFFKTSKITERYDFSTEIYRRRSKHSNTILNSKLSYCTLHSLRRLQAIKQFALLGTSSGCLEFPFVPPVSLPFDPRQPTASQSWPQVAAD